MFRLVLVGLIGVLAATIAQSAFASGIIDDMKTSSGWVISPRDARFGYVAFSAGTMNLFRAPTSEMQDIAVTKKYRVPVLPNTWVHVRVRQVKPLLGADMYTIIRLGGKKVAEFNVNGEERWLNNGMCMPRTNDNSLHIGLAADNREYILNSHNSLVWTNDVPVIYAAPTGSSYANWNLYSIKYHVPEDGVARWRFFVNSQEVFYRDVGYFAPEGQFQNVATVKPISGENELSIEATILGDGDLYKLKPSGTYASALAKGCFSDIAPFLIDDSRIARPQTSNMQWDLIMIGNGLNGDFDVSSVKSLLYSGKFSTATAILTEMLSWKSAEFNCSYVSHDEIRTVRRKVADASDFCLQRMKSDIYAGHISTSDAILTDLISWQNAQFNCRYMSEDEKDRVRKSGKGSPSFCASNP